MSGRLLHLHEPGPDLDSVPDTDWTKADDLAELRDPSGPLVYVCHPKTTYGTVWADAHVARLRALVPDAEIVDPEHCGWESDEDWLAGWPELLRRLDAMVVFSDRDATIGAGCLRECSDAIAYGTALAALDLGLGLCELAGFRFLPDATPARAARIVLGPPIDSLFAPRITKEET